MKKYRISFKAQVDIIVEAPTQESAAEKCQKITLSLPKEKGVFMEPKSQVQIGILETKTEQLPKIILDESQTLN